MSDNIVSLEKSGTKSLKIGHWLGQFLEVRNNLLDLLEKIPEEAIDFTPDERKIESIGTLLFHIAAIEWSWIFEDIDGKEFKEEEWKYAFALRPSVNIPQLTGKEKNYYIQKITRVREDVITRIQQMNDKDLDRIIIVDKRSVTIEWILYHIIEHEAIHLGQINLIYRLYRIR